MCFFHFNFFLQIELSDKRSLLRKEEQRNKELMKSEENYLKCADEKAILEAERDVMNFTDSSRDELMENITKCHEGYEKLKNEFLHVKESLLVSNSDKREYGHQIVKLREQVENYNQYDAKQARKLWEEPETETATKAANKTESGISSSKAAKSKVDQENSLKVD